MESDNQKKLRPEEKQIHMQVYKTENGPEATIIARDSFVRKGENGKTIFNMQADLETKSIKLQEDDTIIKLDRKKIQSLYNEKIISSDTYKALIDILNDYSATFNQSKNSTLSYVATEKTLLKIPQQIEGIRTLLASIDLIDIEKHKFPLKDEHINSETSFGANKVLMDRLYYLPELINACRLINQNQELIHTK